MRATFTRHLVVLALALVGCAHAKTTETVEPLSPEPQSATESTPRKLPAAPTNEHPKKNVTPVASGALGLLRPGAEKSIHDKLSAGGYIKEDANGSTEAALRRFQSANDLPATGVPDHETVRKLGLDPDDLFRKAAN